MLQGRVTLAIQPEVCIVQTLDKPVSAFQPVATPRLHGKRLVQVVFMACLLVGLLDLGLDGFGRGEGPEDQRFQ